MQADLAAAHLIKQALQNQGHVDLPAQGTSMYPLIRQGNVCRFIRCEALQLRKGDVILYHTPSGALVAHRLLSIERTNGQLLCRAKGDTNLGFDEPVRPEQIIGKLSSIRKARYELKLPGLPARMWGRLIVRFPLLTAVLRAYLNRNPQG